MAERIPASTTIRVPLQAYLASDHITPAPGVTIAIQISKNGAAYGNPSGGATNAVEIGSGSYYVDLSTTDTGTNGPLFVKGTSATIDNVVAIYNVVNQYNGGFLALPNIVSGAVGSVLADDTLTACTGLPTTKGQAITYSVQQRNNAEHIDKVTGIATLYENNGTTPKTTQTYASTATTADRSTMS